MLHTTARMQVCGGAPQQCDRIPIIRNLKKGKLMTTTNAQTSKPQILLSGLAFGESPRWHDGRLWFSHWGTKEIVAVDSMGNNEVMVRLPFDTFPLNDGATELPIAAGSIRRCSHTLPKCEPSLH